MATPQRPTDSPPAIDWNWSNALFGALIVIPAAVVAAGDASKGMAFAVGVLPAAVTGVAAVRRRRALLVLIGLSAALAMFLGAVLAHVPVVAVIGVFALSVASALLTERSPLGRLAMVLALPLVGVGLSYSDLGEAVGLSVIMAAGSLWAFLVAMAWPSREAPAPAPTVPTPPMLDYGVRLGLAAAAAATVGFALDLDHVGWACAAALLVMRPGEEMLELRAVGRLVSVAVGATLAGLMATGVPDGLAYSAAAFVAITAAAATHRSRWYVTSAFSTFLALTLIVHSDPSQAGGRWLERMSETLLGVALAYLFGVAVPQLRRRTRTGRV